MTDRTAPARIYLQPKCCADPDVGRLWCEDDEPVRCECPEYDPETDERGTWTEYVRAPAWQPVATAPKDGTVVRLHHPGLLDADFNPSGSCEAFWQQDLGWQAALWNSCHDAWSTVEIRRATHWMPLPEPPATP